MEHKSTELPQETKFVIRIIKSCKTPVQMQICEKLIENYRELYKDSNIEAIDDAFHTKAIQTNYYQHKKVNEREKLK